MKREFLKAVDYTTVNIHILSKSTGNFPVRSGILISVHSFANDPSRGIFILIMLVALIGGGLLAYAFNSKKFVDENEVKLYSKEGFFSLK